jgi:hypothetical protein
MSDDESPTSERIDSEKMSVGQHVQHTVAKAVDYLRRGLTTRKEAVEVKTAAERAISDHDVSRAVR